MASSLERLWKYTQTPELHGQWDLRFTRIEYLPKTAEEEPQHFLYETQIGFGIKVSGKGMTSGSHSKESGESTSALKFWSDEKISIIKTGSGYWKYIPHDKGITFLTWYDYETRHGGLGSIIDKYIFRLLIGWATAWSFDSLRLWLDKEIHPKVARTLYLIFLLANFTIAISWFYHGIIPKLMHMETGELDMMKASGLFAGMEATAVYAVGIGEIIFGLLFLFAGRSKLLHVLNICGLLALGATAFLAKSAIYNAPFNPATTSFGILALSIIVLSIRKFLPDAGNCKRKPEKKRNVHL
jgi:hypothetical protein